MATRTLSASGESAGTATKRKPEFATRVTGANHPHLDATPPYLLTFHAQRWMVMAGKLVPSLQAVPLVAGVNCVDIDKDGRVHFAKTRARLEEEGRVVVPYEWAPDGESYIRPVDTRPDGGVNIVEAWISVFEHATNGSRSTTTDEDAYAAWLESLVASGKLPKCETSVIQRMHDQAENRAQEARAQAAKNGGNGRAALRARAIEAELEVLAAALAEAKKTRAPMKAKAPPKLDDPAKEA